MTGSPADGGSWIRHFHPAPNRQIRLVCLPHAGGSASFYMPLSRALSPAVEVLAIQYPGRQDRRAEASIDSIPAMADQILLALRPFADEPLAFFGHSMGAVLAFEVSARLLRDGWPAPARLFLSGRRAPSRYREEHVHERDDQGIVAELQHLSGTDPAVLADPEILSMILAAVRNDYRAVETYRPQPGQLLTCPLTVLVGDADPKVSADEARAWDEHSSGQTDLHVFAGGHFFLSEQWPLVTTLISESLTPLLARNGRSVSS